MKATIRTMMGRDTLERELTLPHAPRVGERFGLGDEAGSVVVRVQAVTWIPDGEAVSCVVTLAATPRIVAEWLELNGWVTVSSSLFEPDDDDTLGF